MSVADPVDRSIKRRRVLDVLDDTGKRSVLLTSAAAVNWYLDGARTHVGLAADPIVAVRVDRDNDTVVLTRNEQERLLAEELPTAVQVQRLDWWQQPSRAEADATEAELAVPLRRARASLLPAETGRFRDLGRDCAEVLTDILGRSAAVDTERSVAGRVTGALAARGIDPLVVLVGGESRRLLRHPLPRDEALGRRALVVVCGRRHGLIANLSRWVRFGPADPQQAELDVAIRSVEAAYLEASRPGATVGEAFLTGRAAYATAGFDADEWRRHHQGGPAGYAGRDPRATPEIADVIQEGQAFAWNPTSAGTKVEDTVLVGASGWVSITDDPNWPTEGGRPAELRLA
ncbi:MAG: peptidase [Glaciihabitans sp.]|nr:peptidase [Glaciihabitans sp.]